MTPTLVALVLASALAHAYWNFLLKRGAATAVFIGLSKLAEVVVFAPFFVVFALPGVPRTSFALLLIGIATAGVLANYVALTLAYRHGDLSLAYPVSRGATLVFLPVLAFLLLGERLSPRGVAGLAAIVAGVIVLTLPSLTPGALSELVAHLRHRAILWALIVGLVNAVFTLWDKYALRTLAPFAYMYAYTALTAAAYAAWIWTRHPRRAVAAEWRAHGPAIVQVGVLNTLSYLLILFALRSGVSSYIIGFRQLSIAAGVILGWRWLAEPATPPRRVGVALIVVGGVLVATAR